MEWIPIGVGLGFVLLGTGYVLGALEQVTQVRLLRRENARLAAERRQVREWLDAMSADTVDLDDLLRNAG